MTEKHRYYEFIKAYIEGKEVEYRNTACDFEESKWKPVPNLIVFECIPVTFRLKPQKKKSFGYRRYLHKQGGGVLVSTIWEVFANVRETQDTKDFIRWIDNEWQYEEYEE